MTIGWPHEGMWTRRLSPEAEAVEICQIAGARALNALRHDRRCSCVACRVWQQTLRQARVGVRS